MTDHPDISLAMVLCLDTVACTENAACWSNAGRLNSAKLHYIIHIGHAHQVSFGQAHDVGVAMLKTPARPLGGDHTLQLSATLRSTSDYTLIQAGTTGHQAEVIPERTRV